jgi:hypothetical protein
MPPRAAPLYRERRENFTITLHHHASSRFIDSSSRLL